MSRLRTLQPGDVARVGLVVVLVVASAALVVGLRRTAPVATAGVVEIVPAPDLFARCPRTMEPGPSPAPRARPFRPGDRVRSAEVTACPAEFDQKTVTYVGEVVGDVLARAGGVWVQVNDDAYALELGPLATHGQHRGQNTGLAVWLPGELAEVVSEAGRASRRGDVIAVRGTLLRIDPADGGGLTIRAEQVDLVTPAEPVDRPVHRLQALAGAFLLLLAGLAFGVERWQADHR